MTKYTENNTNFLTADFFPPAEEIRRVELRYEYNAALTEAVKQGNLALAMKLLQGMTDFTKDLVRTTNTLRNSQNLCIILNTQLRCTLEDVGIHPYKLDQLSGKIARRIEQFKSPQLLEAYFTEIIRQYCELVLEENLRSLSLLVRTTITYIHSHLSDNLTVKDTARLLNVNADYLSHQFCQEVGMPFISYVNQMRAKQAAALLKRTALTIQQIASAVGYNNNSYFAKQFTKFYGMTPREYRLGL